MARSSNNSTRLNTPSTTQYLIRLRLRHLDIFKAVIVSYYFLWFWPEPGTARLGGVWEDGLEAGEGGVGHTHNGPGDEGEEIHGDGVRDGALGDEIHTLSKQGHGAVMHSSELL